VASLLLAQVVPGHDTLAKEAAKGNVVINQIMRPSLRAILLPTFAVSLYAQAPITVPAGLPDWAFNIPDKVQPASVRPEGIVRAQGSRKEYDAAKIAGNANPPDWFPEEHEPAPRSVQGGPGSLWLVAPVISCRAKGIPNPLTWPACRLNT